jgi:hypothetical protein
MHGSIKENALSRTLIRRLVVASSAVLVVGVLGAGSAFAAGTLPANNPIDYAGMQRNASAHAFVVAIKGSKFEGAAFSSTVGTKPGGGDFAAKIAVSKGVAHNYMITQTITITPNCGTTTKCTVASAFATLSGGNFGSGVITGTKLAKNGTSYVITMKFDEQGTNPNLNIKFYLYRS